MWLNRQTVPTVHNPVSEKYLRTSNRDCGTNCLRLYPRVTVLVCLLRTLKKNRCICFHHTKKYFKYFILFGMVETDAPITVFIPKAIWNCHLSVIGENSSESVTAF